MKHTTRSREVEMALKQAGAMLVRSKRHLVYRFPNGRTLSMAATPSCRFADRKVIRDIERITKP